MSNRLSHLQNQPLDLIVIGGGIVGSGIARDAALRGLRTALFEKNDYCSGTTSRSTRLIHGGLRYLETLDFRFVRLDLREREILLRIAPNLVKPLPFVVPFYGRSRTYRAKINLGLILYDILSFDSSLPRHRSISVSEVRAAAPLVESEALQGGVLYYDAQVESPERLVLENLIDAQEHGAFAYNYSEVVGGLAPGDSGPGVRVRDLISRSEAEVKGRVIVNAAGPWVDQVSNRMAAQSAARARLTKGIHFVCPSLSKKALVFFSRLDDRLLFVVPWLGQSLIGTTDTDFSQDPGEAAADPVDIKYLLDSVRLFIPSLDISQIRYSYAGVRALVPEPGKRPSAISRMHQIVDEAANGAPGLISVIGGKITGYRAIAEQAVDLACSKLGRRRICRTESTLLPGARGQTLPGKELPRSLEPETVRHLFSLYGSRASEVIQLAHTDSRLRSRIAPDSSDIAAQVIYSVRREQCLRATDFLLRRTRMGFSPDQGCRALPAVIALMADELGWSATKKNDEFEAHVRWVHQTQECLS
jgi:glycerol-3-phosphate dehydrogenase